MEVIQPKKLQSQQRGAHISEYRKDRVKVIGKRDVKAVKRKQFDAGDINLQQHIDNLGISINGKSKMREGCRASLCLNLIGREKIQQHFMNRCDISDKAIKKAL